MIGIFDSGSGGLTVLRAVRRTLPLCDVIYFGDTINAPYGNKSQEELARLTSEAIALLRAQGAQRIISACNSTSTALALSVLDAFDLAPEQLVEMVGPTVAHVRGLKTRIALVATPATIRSGMYQNAFRMIGHTVEAIPIERLAGAIEAGATREHIAEIIRDALSGVSCDVLILACTHFPLVADIFAEELPHGVTLVDPAELVAYRVKVLWWPREVGSGTTTFFLSAPHPRFEVFVSELFPNMQYTLKVLESSHEKG